jgi:FixJ family two-component response regulator
MAEAPVVHVVDDDDAVRNAVTRLLRLSGFQSRGYRSAGEFLLAERPDAPGCLILDMRLPGPSGLDLHQRLSEEKFSLPVIFLTGYADVATCVQAMKAGAVDFLLKPVRREPLLESVTAALARDAANRELRHQLSGLQERYETLTSRERQVLALVVSGRLNKEIAGELGNSERTVKAHRAHIMDKMQAGSVADLVRAADQLRRSGLA